MKNSIIRDAVVVLKAPKVEGDRLTFDVNVLEGDLAGADGPASIFIDCFGFAGFRGALDLAESAMGVSAQSVSGIARSTAEPGMPGGSPSGLLRSAPRRPSGPRRLPPTTILRPVDTTPIRHASDTPKCHPGPWVQLE
jgi:hypothetical protein